MNSFINENSEELKQELRPHVNGVLADMIKQVSENFFERVPFSELFPKR